MVTPCFKCKNALEYEEIVNKLIALGYHKAPTCCYSDFYSIIIIDYLSKPLVNTISYDNLNERIILDDLEIFFIKAKRYLDFVNNYSFFNETFTISKEKILRVAERDGNTKRILTELFPEAFEDNRTFCKIGSILTSTTHKSVYAVIKQDNQVMMLNISCSEFWKTHTLEVSELKNPKSLTYSEFSKLIEGTPHKIENFKTVVF